MLVKNLKRNEDFVRFGFQVEVEINNVTKQTGCYGNLIREKIDGTLYSFIEDFDDDGVTTSDCQLEILKHTVALELGPNVVDLLPRRKKIELARHLYIYDTEVITDYGVKYIHNHWALGELIRILTGKRPEAINVPNYDTKYRYCMQCETIEKILNNLK